MHFEFLVEDQSGGMVLNTLVPWIIGTHHTLRIKTYKGIGHLPKGMKPRSDANKRILLDQLPRLLGGYGKTYHKGSANSPTAVIVVCDLDDRCLKSFRKELLDVLNACNPKPETRFCIAIEEGEAWFLGDIPAIKSAYPKTKDTVLKKYKSDSICGTWEKLADAVFPGGATALKARGWQAVGREKSAWAEKITTHMNVDNNTSPSFCHFRLKIRELAGVGG